MNAWIPVGLLIIGLCLSSGAPANVTSTSDYDLTVAGSVDTPTLTVNIEGESFTVSAVAKATAGDTLTVSVSAPSDADYRVNLYNGDRQVAAQRPASGTSSVEFDLTDYDPGSYMLLLYQGGDYKNAYPVVVKGYDTTVTVPSEATTDSELDVTIRAEKITQVSDPSKITVVLANDEQTVEATATKQGNEYHATLSLSEFQPGQARIYAAVQGTEDAFKDGRKQLLGISDATTLTIREPTTRMTTDSTDPATTTTQNDSGETPTTTTTTVTTTSVTETSTTSTDSTTQSTEATTHTSTSTQRTPSSSTTSPTTESNVITPNQTTTTTISPHAGQGIPGFGFGIGLIALGSFLVLLLRR